MTITASILGQRSPSVSEYFYHFNLQMISILSTFPEDCVGKDSIVYE